MIRLSAKNTTHDELALGSEGVMERVCTPHDLWVFAHASGDANPLNRPGTDANGDGRDDAQAPPTWLGALVGTALGSLLPGAGTILRSLSLTFPAPAAIGDRLRVRVRCTEKLESPVAVFAATVTRGDGAVVAEGMAVVDAPLTSIALDESDGPVMIVDAFDHFGPLIERCRTLPPLVAAVVCPDDATSLAGALLAAKNGLITPILVGSRERIEAVAEKLSADLGGFSLIDVPDPASAAARAVAMVLAGEAQAIMKGNLHSDQLLASVVKADGGLRLARRISHAFVIDAPTLDHLLFISDAAINIAPDLMAKVDITQNAIDLARACGIARPKVGILSAVETVNPAIASTIDAAVLAKMAERGQITGGIVDGPLAMDNAMDVGAARTKGISSLVAGHADVLIVPNLEAGNILAKELAFVGRAESAGLVLGAKVPIILTSRADNDRARLASCALAQLYAWWRLHGEALAPGA